MISFPFVNSTGDARDILNVVELLLITPAIVDVEDPGKAPQ
jgi:hypothetical protein